MAPGSISYHICFQSTFICIFTFCIYIIKYQKIYLSNHTIFIRSHFRKWPWSDWQPLYCVGCEFFICLCRCVRLLRSLLLNWYLGSQKLREILTLLCCITLSSSRKTNASSRRSKKDFWRRCRGSFHQVKTYQVPITNLSPSHLHYLPFASRFPLPHFTLAVLLALSFHISSSLPFAFPLLWPNQKELRALS